MRILALETTDLRGTVAALDGPTLVREIELDPQLRSARSLAPALKTLLAEVGWQARQIELVAVAVGPGSFTGLRVGVTTAKILAYTAKAPAVGVDTLAAIAARAPADVALISTALDAQRGDVTAQLFARQPATGRMQPTGPQTLVDTGRWLAELPDGCWIAGPILEKLRPGVPPRLNVVEPGLWRPTASAVGLLGLEAHAAGRSGDPAALLPHYSRRAAAEEKWEAKQKGVVGK